MSAVQTSGATASRGARPVWPSRLPRVPRAARVERLARLALLAATAACGASCASFGGRRAEDRAVTVGLSVSRPDAVRRTLAAFRDQGYRVKESLTSGTDIVTQPFAHTDDIEATFKAAITASGGASRVVLSGTYRERSLGGIVRGREHPIVRATEGVEGELWARLQNLALAIRTPP